MKIPMPRFAGAAALMLGGLITASAQAAPVFSDDFESYGGEQLNWNGGGNWTVTDGTVDLIAIPNVWGITTCNSTSHCVDLDGSTQDAGVLSRTFAATAGTTYQLTAQVSGSQRLFGDPGPDVYRNVPNSALFGFRDAGGGVIGEDDSIGPLVYNAGFSTVMANFIAPLTGTYTIFFSDLGGDAVGLMLDDVNLTAVPLPAAAWLLLSGLACVGAFARRRRVAGTLTA